MIPALSIWAACSVISIIWYCAIRHRWCLKHGQFGTSVVAFIGDLVFLAVCGPIALIAMPGFERWLTK